MHFNLLKIKSFFNFFSSQKIIKQIDLLQIGLPNNKITKKALKKTFMSQGNVLILLFEKKIFDKVTSLFKNVPQVSVYNYNALIEPNSSDTSLTLKFSRNNIKNVLEKILTEVHIGSTTHIKCFAENATASFLELFPFQKQKPAVIIYDTSNMHTLFGVNTKNDVMDDFLVNMGYELVHHKENYCTASFNEKKLFLKIDDSANTFTREALLDLIPKNGTFAEIGVFQGGFSEKILTICNPSEFHLIDLFSSDDEILSPSPDGNTMVRITGKNLENFVRSTFSAKKEVTIHKGSSHKILNTFPDDYFDFIYIDGDHYYGGVKRDLELSRKKVKNGGWICGHDYNDKRYYKHGRIFLGCVRAVNEFCKKHQLSISYLTEPKNNMIDCQLSYAIKNTK